MITPAERVAHPDFVARSVIAGALIRHAAEVSKLFGMTHGYATVAEAMADEILRELRRFCTVEEKPRQDAADATD
jgi:hypothetical protein